MGITVKTVYSKKHKLPVPAGHDGAAPWPREARGHAALEHRQVNSFRPDWSLEDAAGG